MLLAEVLVLPATLKADPAFLSRESFAAAVVTRRGYFSLVFPDLV